MAPALPTVDIVIFGGHGDLAVRKIMPALYHLFSQNLLNQESRIISTSHTPLSHEEHLSIMRKKLKEHLQNGFFIESEWTTFAACLHCIVLDVTQTEDYTPLQDLLNEYPKRDRVNYLSTSSSLFGDICSSLHRSKLITQHSRVVLEKPIGHDLQSFQEIDDQVTAVFEESAIYRIDHYLGKDTVQNILALRFSNVLFIPLWNSLYIDHVQITVAEEVGLEGRLGYYDKYGAMRDMVQNHLMQLLCLIAMEPPSSLNGDSVRNEKVKVLKSLRKMSPPEISQKTVRGQYRAGMNKGSSVPGYLDEGEEPLVSDTETFVALRADIDNWTWRGVPFYLRTGKRMPKRYSEIIIQFKNVPHSVFPKGGKCIQENKLIIRLQPEESITLSIMNKVPGLTQGIRLRPVELDLNIPENSPRTPTAYERLILDVINKDSTLFMRRDEVEAAWVWADTILQTWQEDAQPVKHYQAGTYGPTSSIALIERDGRSWHEE
ncbi:MAG: Glucose-6-phosphate 1-dehydrogenase (EC [uncultured Thiotrichaceae bacterium]|uniref:Glucose-6-phosphate 1-dehydrogenase n=1 Tax=uncultured Thiotrichaceae bacterium TaxID=298394 RepID=A0A6S6UBC3_9GAMM|nr:MAG: Glucose-6-phosphate 1-dehydrogenase (EC [uncultured Thiotrichaceae bacterium]